MRIKIYQIDSEKDLQHRKFQSLNDEKVDPSIYKNVFYGDVEAESLEDVFQILNTEIPGTYQGHSLSVSDIVEVCSDNKNLSFDKGCYYCNSFGFKSINFDSSKCAEMDGMNVVYITPHNTPIETKIGTNLIDSQKAVGGLIELLYNNDGTIIVCNDEAKLIGMEGNRKLDSGSIIAGPFFICGDDGEEFRSLTDEEVNKYMNKFAEPDEISEDEVQADTGFIIYGM